MPSRELGRKALVLLSNTWATSALGMAISIAVARRLGPDAVGAIGFSLGLAGMFMAATIPGFRLAHHKRLAEGQDPGRCIGTMAAIQAGLTVIAMGVLVASWSLMGRGFTPSLNAVFAWMLGAQIASTFADIALRVFLAREWVVAHAAILLGGRLLRAGTTAIVLIVVPDVVWVAAMFTLEAVLNGVIAATVLFSRGVRIRAPTRETVHSYWTYARPLLVTTPLALFQDSVDRFVVGRWAGLTAAGYYHVARALWEVLGSALSAPTTVLFTRLSSLYAKRTQAGDADARALFASALDKMLFVIVPVAILVWALAERVVSGLYGDDFLSAATALRILVLASVVEALAGPYMFAIYALGAGDRLVRVDIARTAIYALALLALVPPDGIVRTVGLHPGESGAAVARLVLIAVPVGVYWRWTKELAGIRRHPAAAAYVAALGVALAGHAAVTPLPIPGPTWLASAIAAAIALGAYLLLLLSLHAGARDNFEYVRTLLSPRRLAAFLSGASEGPV